MSKEGEKPSREVLLDPKRRLRELSERGSCVDVKKAVPVKRYFRSGSELERQASGRREGGGAPEGRRTGGQGQGGGSGVCLLGVNWNVTRSVPAWPCTVQCHMSVTGARVRRVFPQASVYFEERQLDKAFILYIKFAT